MRRYLISRLLQSIAVVWGVVTVVFLILRVLPGDPAALMLGFQADAQSLEALRREMGLDRSIPEQYAIFLSGALRGDFGSSLYSNQPSLRLVLEKTPATLELAAMATILSLAIAFPLGILAALQVNKWPDKLVSATTLVAQALPDYWMGLMLMLLFSLTLQLLPTSGKGSWQHLIMPVITLGFPMTSIVTRLVRTGILENTPEDYVRTAQAKGLSDRAVLFGHVIRNSLIPVITVTGLQMGSLLGGAVIVETVFSWPGLGFLTLNAILRKDYPLVEASVFVIAIMFVLINLATDLIYAYVDPRIRYA